MSRLHPVLSDYQPGYPARLTAGEIQDLLRPGLVRRFGARTLLAGAALMASFADAGAADALPPLPQAGHGTRTDPALRARVDQAIDEVLGKTPEGFWGKYASAHLLRELSRNPPVKYPDIPISYGNSYVGVFDAEAARAATMRLFEAYGLTLRAGVEVAGDGYDFVADGYDPEHEIGFCLTLDPERATRRLRNGEEAAREPTGVKLGAAAQNAVAAAVAAGKRRLFIAQIDRFPNMDGDLYTPMQYYLTSVVDYLNWVHGDQVIDLRAVVRPTPPEPERERGDEPILPGADVETDADLACFRGDGVSIARAEQWSSHGGSCLAATFQPGCTLTYRPPDTGAELETLWQEFRCRVFMDQPGAAGVTLTITLIGDDGTTWTITAPVREGESMYLREFRDQRQAPIKRLRSIVFACDNREPVTIHIDELRLNLPQPARK